MGDFGDDDGGAGFRMAWSQVRQRTTCGLLLRNTDDQAERSTVQQDQPSHHRFETLEALAVEALYIEVAHGVFPGPWGVFVGHDQHPLDQVGDGPGIPWSVPRV